MAWQNRIHWAQKSLQAAVLISLIPISAGAQDQTTGVSATPSISADRGSPSGQNSWEERKIGDLCEQMRELKSMMAEMRIELTQSRAEVLALRRELGESRGQLAPKQAATPPADAEPEFSGVTQPQSLGGTRSQNSEEEHRVARLEEDYKLLEVKVDEQYQTKVEGASKYRVRLSGIVLMNAFSNQGSVENQDFPTWAVPRSSFESRGSFGATLRQSQLGLEVFGPELDGAKTRADIQIDFAGGFPSTLNGVTLGIVRLRTAAVHLDWAKTSIVAGQDVLFFSPLSPTSLASLAVPALTNAGNLWNWTSQVRIERRFDLSANSSVKLQGGILDPLTGELPADPFSRFPSAGERSRQPAYASRISWTHHAFGRNISLGAGGYYSSQNWGFERNVESWAATGDWSLPFGAKFDLSGEFYRGRAVGGLGGGIGQSILLNGALADPATRVRGFNSAGGWAQLKFRASERWELNGAFGEDNPFTSDLRRFPAAVNFLGPLVARNQSAFVNFIYHPRTALLFSTEYRHLHTIYVPGSAVDAGQVNLSVGVLF